MSELSEPCMDVSEAIAALRLLGADKFDPVRLHYLQALATRVNAHEGPVKRILDAKLAQALLAFKERFAQAEGEARDAIDRIAPQVAQVNVDVQRLFKAGDFKGVRQFIASQKPDAQRPSLGDLTRYMAQQAPESAEAGFESQAGLRPELKTTRYFRNTWSKLSVDKRVTQAIDQAPKNAGPLNAHRLVLRSLAMMRDISPDYLNRFTLYVDTLLCLEQCDDDKQVTTKKAAEAENIKKIKSRRVKSR